MPGNESLEVSTPHSDLFVSNLSLYQNQHLSYDADHDQATNGFGSKILKVFKLSGYLQ